ncbi:MAG: hypothetical protein ACOC0P_02925 [Planctomycetota bacterium]
MSVNAGQANINDAVKQLQQAWQRVRDNWDDPVAEHFEREFLTEIEPRTRQTLHAMATMQELLARIRQDCES